MQPPGPDAPPPTATDNTGPAQDPGASFQTFYDDLSNQGTWIQTDNYGYVWQPQVNDPNWAPYTEGHWVYSDDGWTWASDESFGWATYHYGRWANLDGTGWVWVPGYTWGPAWVSWRYGDNNVGWAPLPPDSFAGIDYSGDGFDADYGYHIGGDCDGYYGIGPEIYIFLPINCLGYRHYHGFYHNRHDNFGLINHTTNVTNINVTRRGASGGASYAFGSGRARQVTAGGPQLAQVNAASATPVQRVSLERAGQPGAATLTGSSLSLYAPHIRPASASERPLQIGATLGTTRVNRGTNISQPLMVNAHLAPPSATDSQVDAARTAMSHPPANAKVLADAGTFHPVFQGSVTTLKPITRETSPAFQAPATRGYAPGAVYGDTAGRSIYGPVRTPSVMGEPSPEPGEARSYTPGRVYVPGSATTTHYGTAPPEGNGEAGGRTYSRGGATPAPASSAPVSRSSSGSSSGGSSGGGHAAPSGGSSGGSSSSGAGHGH